MIVKGRAAALCAIVASGFLVAGYAKASCMARPGAWMASPTAAVKPQILVIGGVHMANPDLDVADAHVSDMLAAKRQAQIRQVVAILREFKPTKIAVERLPNDPHLASRYARYVAGTYALNDTEAEQFGFRLAKELGLKSVCGVDARVGLDMNPRKYAKAEGLLKEYDTWLKQVKDETNADTAFLGDHTVLQFLTRINSNPWISKDVGFYYQAAHFGKPGRWGGADLVALWFKRNMRIYANIIHLIGSPHARILVIFGAGHLAWLRHDFSSDPTVQLRTLQEYLH